MHRRRPSGPASRGRSCSARTRSSSRRAFDRPGWLRRDRFGLRATGVSPAARGSRGRGWHLDTPAVLGDHCTSGRENAAPEGRRMSGAARRAVWWLVIAGLVVATGPAQAAEIHVLSAGAVRSIVTDLAQAFEKETGHKVSLAFGTVGVTRKRLATDPADVVIMSDVAIDESIKQDALVAGSRVDIARTGMGVGVRDGAPKPD